MFDKLVNIISDCDVRPCPQKTREDKRKTVREVLKSDDKASEYVQELLRQRGKDDRT